ncbi:helix-turn-helix domain-containing protein [Pseudonocardia alaniniphila]|uniref:Helix-turn-helix domain-containing protein n=1 Tax=Pseudonocardia alaniniphila TaxID=75291 RepID=A0ABS9T9M2_9PSEU|nr:helix-turn-helix domain-containing protein [Pseudonocardia alaniniphila]MCH6164991.1 helix-turn-helix domain-containing protein [Pseudonocardia alaniniphila]
MARVISTDAVEAADRLDFWTDAVCDTYIRLDCDAPGHDVVGDIRVGSVATLEFSRVTSTAQQVRRTRSLIAAAAEDYVLVGVQAEGVGYVVQDERIAQLRPGDFAVYDSTRPYELRFEDDFQQYVLMIPGPTLRAQLGPASEFTARSVCGSRGAGALAAEMIRMLNTGITVIEPSAAADVALGIEHIVTAGLSSLVARSAPEPTRAARREQVKACARGRLRDPRLSVASIAAHLHTSVSTLHRAFAGEPCSISEWIWAQRLDAVRADLCAPALRHRTIGDLAFSWGFVDASHFSRAFKARFGCTARDVRLAQAGGSTTNWRNDRSR